MKRSILFLLTFSWLFGIAWPAFSEREADDKVIFIPPREAIERPRLSGGGSRCSCINYDEKFPPLAALVPELEDILKQHYPQNSPFLSADISLLKSGGRGMPGQQIPRGGLTSQAFPSLFVYVPTTNAIMGAVLLVEHLPDGTFEERHYEEFSLPTDPGIVRLSSPIALEEDKIYEWLFILICDDEDRNGDAVASATIKRVSLPDRLKSHLDRASLTTQLEIYGEAGLWYDFFALLATEQQRSHQFQEIWATILNNELEQDRRILQAPFLPCCSSVARVQSTHKNSPSSFSFILEKYGLR